jgi:phosphatidate cytidylyltransferase
VIVARVGTAVVAIPLLLFLTWLGGPAFWALALIAAGVAAREAWLLLGNDRSPVWASAAVVVAVLLVAGATAGPAVLLAALGIAMSGLLTLDLVTGRAEPTSADPGLWRLRWPTGLAASTYAALPIALLVLIRGWAGPDRVLASGAALQYGAAWVIFTFTVVWAVDSAAFVVGRSLGRHVLWPRVSPRKTWEGTIAGLVAGPLAALAWSSALNLGLPAPLLGLALAISAVVGDLAESQVKRAAGVKDASALLPGHGGLLDRLDSVGFAAVVVFFIGVLSGH